jgi:hypothetical protein
MDAETTEGLFLLEWQMEALQSANCDSSLHLLCKAGEIQLCNSKLYIWFETAKVHHFIKHLCAYVYVHKEAIHINEFNFGFLMEDT